MVLFNLLSVDENRKEPGGMQSAAFEHIFHPAAFAYFQAVFLV